MSATHTNFVWLRVPGVDSERLRELLLAEGVRVMAGIDVGDEEHVRATVRSDSAATDRLADALLKVASGYSPV